MNRPVTTLFMLMSVDGKISTGAADVLDVVVAPVLIGGKDTTTLIDGHSLQSRDELNQLGVLRLIEATPLQDSYLRLRYQVIG